MLTGPLGSIDVGRVYGKMPPKQVAKSQDDDRAPEDEAAWHESKRLQELAYKGVGLLPLQLSLHDPGHTAIQECERCVTEQMLSETRRMCTEEAVPSKGTRISALHGCKDVFPGLDSNADT